MSSNLRFLEPSLQVKAQTLLARLGEAGISARINQTYRSLAEQAKKYRATRGVKDIKAKEASFRKLGFDNLADILIKVGPQDRPEWLPKGNLTNAGPGESKHHAMLLEGDTPYSYAFDIACFDGKGEYISNGDDTAYKLAGKIGQEIGLEWLGNSTKFKESAHFQAKGLPSTKIRMGLVSE